MRAVVQRVENCSVSVDGTLRSSISKGLLVYLGISRTDTQADIAYIVDKVSHMRIFSDPEGKMNLSVNDVGGSLLIVSQFTLYGDARKGRRPSYSDAAEPGKARILYEACKEAFRSSVPVVEEGEFQAMMDVSCTNKGPVTILLDSEKKF